MRLLLLGLSNLRRNRRRTWLTGLSLGLAVFLFTVLTSVLAAINQMVESAGESPVMIVTHKGGYVHDLPERHAAYLRSLPDVKSLISVIFYGGIYGDAAGPQETFPSLGIDNPDAYHSMFRSRLKVSDEDWQAFKAERTAALVGPQLAERYGWKRGDQITLKGTSRPVDLTFRIVGLLEFHTDRSTFLFHRDYLEQALGRPGLVTMFEAELTSLAAMPAVRTEVESQFAASPDPVKTMSEQQMMQSFLAIMGDVRGLVMGLGVLVMFAVFFVTLNSMALSARERTSEFALLKVLGFAPKDVLVCMLFESLVLSLVAGLAASGAAYLLLSQKGLGLGGGVLSGFGASPGAMGLGLAAAAATGLLAALVPGLRAARLSEIEALRRKD